MNLIIGYVGSAFSGKDTSSKELKALLTKDAQSANSVIDDKTQLIGEQLDYTNKNITIWHTPLALAVKMEFVEEQAALGIQIDLKGLLYDEHYKNRFRADLIRIGDGKRETVHPLYWINKVQKLVEQLEAVYSNTTNIFQVTDMRYENEVPEFEKYCYARSNINMLSVKIHASLNNVLKRMPIKHATEYAQKHRLNQSERNIKRVQGDINLDNNGTLSDLREQIAEQIIPVVDIILA